MAGAYKGKDVVRSDSLWFKFASDGDSIKVMFILDKADEDLGAFPWPRHFAGKYAACAKIVGADVSCEHCTAGVPQQWRVSITVWDVEKKERRILSGMPVGFLRTLRKQFATLEKLGIAYENSIYVVAQTDNKKEARLGITHVGTASAGILEAVKGLVPFTPEQMEPKQFAGQGDSGPDHSEDGDPGPEDEIPL
jgi:hypothetical protein